MPPTPIDPIQPKTCDIPQAPPYGTAPKAKKIFVFLDGTGNEFIAGKNDKDGNSNVVKLYTTLKVADDQVAYYHPGVGTMGDPTIRWRIPRWWSMTKGLAFGAGFKANVLDAYRYLMNVYNDGDQIYIFGFSRGAYTARALAGLLHGYGLLCRGNEGHLLYAWRMMIDEELTPQRNKLFSKRDVRNEKEERKVHTIERNNAYAQTFSRIVTVRFMGIWDTVSSIGWIYKPIRLLDGAQNPIIQVGRHAVAIDERRAFYRDNLWGASLGLDAPDWPQFLKEKEIRQDIAQVWFPGAHSDVGGSYPQTEAAPANVALEWMIGELKMHGAELCEDRIKMVLGGHESQLEAQKAYQRPHPAENKLHDSLKHWWWILQTFPQQYYDKDNAVIQWRTPFGRARSIPSGAIIHGSAHSRLWSTPEGQLPYRPKNLNRDYLKPIDPMPETTANLTGCYILTTPDGMASVPADPTPLRFIKLGIGGVCYVAFWLLLVAVAALIVALVLLLGGVCRIVVESIFGLLNHVPWIHQLLGPMGHALIWLTMLLRLTFAWLIRFSDPHWQVGIFVFGRLRAGKQAEILGEVAA